MKTQTNHRLQSVLLATITIIFLLGASASIFAQGVGAKYGTRDPRTCADTKAPTRGAAMTATLATKYVICSTEGIKTNYLHLIEGLTTVQLGGSRPYNHKNDSVSDIDVRAPVYPFRVGSYKQYSCDIVNESNKGYNCTIYTLPNGTGSCWKTTFGDWNCTLDYHSLDQSESNMPPPTAAEAGATDKPNNTATKNGNQTAAKKVGVGENKADAGLPPPDFSEMEKYFDISKIEYSDGYLRFIGKMTKENNAVDWNIDFYDADGIKVISTNYVSPYSGNYEKVGDIAKYAFYLPAESKWKFVKRVVITRKIL